MQPGSKDLLQALAETAKTINAERSLDRVLDAIAHATRASVPGIDEVGISVLHQDGTIETKAATGVLVTHLDQLQYRLHEGPCVSAIEQGGVVMTEDVTTDERWPTFGAQAHEAGLRAQMGIQLWADATTIGGLNMYSLTCNSIHEDSLRAGQLFANHAALALGKSRIESELHDGMEKRGLIGLALGILMERHHIDDRTAFQYLTRVSQTSNTKIRVIAHEVVDQTIRKHQAT